MNVSPSLIACESGEKMEALAPYLSWIGHAVSQVTPALQTAARSAAPVSVIAPAPVPVSLGLKVLLEPSAGGIIFRAARLVDAGHS